ncbi:MAG: hypothetical protein ACPLPQ_02205 [Candidatus Saccharicenans sp.]
MGKGWMLFKTLIVKKVKIFAINHRKNLKKNLDMKGANKYKFKIDKQGTKAFLGTGKTC